MTIICVISRPLCTKPQRQHLNPRLLITDSCLFDSPLADTLASYTNMVLTIENAYTSSATELIGAGYDRLDS